jgi:hypothetical protein
MPEPFDDYLSALDAAADLYLTDIEKSKVASVSATVSFLRASKVDSRLRTPLLAVLAQLEDRGRAGNTKPSMDAVNMAAIAAVITLAMRTGKTTKQGAELVADHIGIGAHKTENVKRLIQYRKNLMDKRGTRDAENLYKLVLGEASKSRLPPQAALGKGLEFLNDKMVTASATKVRYRRVDSFRRTKLRPDRLSN